MKAVAGIVLSAGSSRRFGEDKLTQELKGRPIVSHVVEAALDSRLSEVVVVVRPGDDAVSSSLPRSNRLRILPNPEHLEGISSSMRTGLRSLSPAVDAAVVLLGDEPEIAAEQINAVVDAYVDTEAPAVRASFGGRLGHPVVLDRRLWADLLAETGDVGARRILDRSSHVEVLEVGDRAPIDVDTKEDLAALRRRLSRK